MAKHGLTEQDQAKLVQEGVTAVDDFNQLEDGDFNASGIDITARREAKLRHDRQCAAEGVRRRRLQQVQELLDVAGLSQAGQDALANVDLHRLCAMDQAELAERGLGIMDRRKLRSVCKRTEPSLPESKALQIAEQEVMTEPQRQEQRRARQEQRRARKEREYWEATKRRCWRLCAVAVACLGLLWALMWVPNWCDGRGRGYHWAIALAAPMTDCNSSLGQVLAGTVVKVLLVVAYEGCFMCVLDKVVRAPPPAWAAKDPRKSWAVLLLVLQLVPYGFFIEAKAWWWEPGRGMVAAVNMILVFARSSHYSDLAFLDTEDVVSGVLMLLIMLWVHLRWWLRNGE